MGYTKIHEIVAEDGEVIKVATYYANEKEEEEYRKLVEKSKQAREAGKEKEGGAK